MKAITFLLASALATASIGDTAAAPILFESSSPANNAATQNSWLTALGIAAPTYTVTFESGFTNGQNVSNVSGLFPGSLTIRDTSPANQALVRSGAGTFGGSNPVGTFALAHNEQPYLEFDFSAAPVDYFGAFGIDHGATSVQLTFLSGATASLTLGSTGSDGDTAKFFGIIPSGMGPIVSARFDASGDGTWGLDNLQYGRVSAPDTGGTFALVSLALAALLLTHRHGRYRSC